MSPEDEDYQPQEGEVLPTHHRDVERRAYEFYIDRGRLSGHALDDWLRAEREVAARADELLAQRLKAHAP